MSVTALSLLQDLLRCPSVTPEDAGALDLIAERLAAAGFTTHRLRFGGGDRPAIENLYARIGTQAPHFLFAGHTDVVPPGDPARWRFPPFAGTVADGRIWGRGACDMKGGVAASVAAALAYLDRHGQPGGSISFLLTGDEEGPAVDGTVKLLDWAAARGERFDHCILGEPTNPQRLGDMIKIGRRGSLSGTVLVQGRQGHVAYPHLADNPLHRLPAVLEALIRPALDTGTAHFDPSNLEITTVDTGNTASNVIPDRVRIRFNIRFNDLWTPSALEAEVQRRLTVADPEGRITLTCDPCNAEAFLTAPGPFTTLVAEAVAAETGRHPALSTTGGTSDARFIKSFCPVVEFGLVGASMHAIDEHAAVEDLACLQRIYERVLEAYFAAPTG